MEGQTVSHYRVLGRVGAGGMGVVYRAEDTRLKRPVAIKMLSPHLTSDDEARDRFQQEAHAASLLEHPNICTIHEIDSTPDGQLFIVMAYCEGETLKSRLARGPLPIAEAVEVTVQILRALQKAHEAGIVHRDVKPANVMVDTDGLVRLVDFGIAKLHDRVDLTRTGTTVGTMAYMSPEQIAGEAADARTDLWAAGVVFYEALAGRPPFRGDSEVAIINHILRGDPAPLHTLRPEVPRALVGVAQRALAKSPALRFASATEFIALLRAWQHEAIPSTTPGGTRFRWQIAAVVALVAVAGIGGTIAWNVKRSNDARAAEEAFQQASTLASGDSYVEAFLRAEQLEQLAPTDPRLPDLMNRVSVRRPITTDPAGAAVFYKAFDDTSNGWRSVGQTPLKDVRLPAGAIRLRIEKPAYETREFIAVTAGIPNRPFVLEPTGFIPAGMVRVPKSDLTLTLYGYDYTRPLPAAEYLIDRFEVTNEQFKAFVDAGGYTRREFWKEPFVANGKTLPWEEAVAQFRDKTGRPGPSTWEVGTFPAGWEKYPVSGVSWYEAAAYAEFSGKQLPTIYHWLRTASVGLASFITPLSNLESNGPAPVGQRPGVTSVGAFDMAGNVREWCANEMTPGATRYILGGAWNDPRYAFYYADGRSPFDRSEVNGFRLARYSEPLSADLAAIVPSPVRDVSRETPVPDAVFTAYRDMYAYDPRALDARVEVTEQSALWTRHKVSFSAAYGNQRIPAFLFIPKNSRPPYQVLVYGPGSAAVEAPTTDLMQTSNIDFLIQSGRAVLYPVYEGTYERRTDRRSVWHELTRAFRDWMIHVVNDARRSVDYLEQRDDMRKDAIAYIGYSWGAQFGTIVAGLEPRLRTVILVSGGIASAKKLPEIDLFNFAPRVKAPVLMVNGDSDFIYTLEHGQKPLFNLLGTPQEHKRHILYPGGHGLAQVRHQLIREVLDWLDQYLGPVAQ